MINYSKGILLALTMAFMLVFGFTLGIAQEEKISEESAKEADVILSEKEQEKVEEKETVVPKDPKKVEEEKAKVTEEKKAVETKEAETEKIEEIKPLEKEKPKTLQEEKISEESAKEADVILSEKEQEKIEEKEAVKPKEAKTEKIEEIKPLEKEKPKVPEVKKAKPAEKVEEKSKIKEKEIPEKKEVKEIKKVTKSPIPAKISFLAGSVKIKRVGSDKWTEAKLNMTLNFLDEIRTGFDSLAVIILNKEDKITIKANTHIVLSLLERDEEEDSWAATLKIWLGEIRSHIEGLKDRRGQYHIETVSAVAGIRGTDFIVMESIDEVTRVICVKGEVEVCDTVFKEKVVLTENQITMVSLNQKPTLPRELSGEELIKFGIIEEKVEKKEIKKEEVVEKPAEIPEKPKEKERPAWRKGINLAAEFGTEVVEGKLYQRISFQPEFCIGKVGVGLDAFVLIDEDNKIRSKDWDEIADIIEKIIYLRYGQKRDPFYVMLGGLKTATLGHGMIMNKYSNLINYPRERKKGIELGIDRKMFGVEAVVDDLRKVNLYGVRAYLRPLVNGKMPFLLNKLTLGGTFCLDKDPNDKDDKEKDIVITGVDAELPLIERKNLGIILYADAAKIKDHGKGIAAPGLLISIPMAAFKAEYRTMESNFIPGYFNYLYELERDTKESLLVSGKPDKKGFYAEFTSNIFNIISMDTYYEDYNHVNPNLSAKIKLVKKIVPQLTLAEATYSQNNIERLKLKTENTYIEWKVGYSISGPISLVYTYSLAYEKDLATPQEDDLKPLRSMSVTTRVDF